MLRRLLGFVKSGTAVRLGLATAVGCSVAPRVVEWYVHKPANKSEKAMHVDAETLAKIFAVSLSTLLLFVCAEFAD